MFNTFDNNNTINMASNSSVASLSSNGQIPQLWMGELDQRWDELTIKQIWNNLISSMGIVIHSIKLIKDKQSTQLGLTNAGYCFIRFHNFEDASKVLNTFNGKPIPGTNNQHYFRLNWSSANIQAAATAAAAASSLPLTSSSAPVEYSIFVGDLPQNINEQILLQTFKSKYPSCTSVKIMVDQTTGNIKGYGFVKFLNEEEQKRSLVEMQGYVLLGRAIRVSTASKSNSSNPNQAHQNKQNHIMINSNQTPSLNEKTASSVPPMSQRTSPVGFDSKEQQINNIASRNLNQPLPQNVPLQYFNDPANTTVFIGGLNVPISEQQMFELFSKFGSISYVKIPNGKNCGFVQFFHRESAELAIKEMQGYDIGGGCKIRVSWGARAAQRSWFARQLQIQQQQQQKQQQLQQLQQQQQHQQQQQLQQGYNVVSPNVQHQQLLQTNDSHFNELSNNNINMMLQMNQTGTMADNLGLFNSYVNINDSLLNMNGYSIDQYNFQNEMIPYTNLSSNDEFKLNKLLLAARDGNLDQLDLGSSLYN